MYYNYYKIFLTEINNVLVEEKNIIEYSNNQYYLKYVDDEFKSSKGGNSSVFILYSKDGSEEKIIKICNYPKPKRGDNPKITKRHGRFINEIKVLYDLKTDEYLSGYILEIYFDGEIQIGDRFYPYYVMEKADTDLKEYLLKNKNILDLQEKYKLCQDALKAIKKLHHHGYYHRDIKPDNVFLFKNGLGDEITFKWKIGDLGLMAERDNDYDDIGERIGPFGWISPEAMNKYLTEKYDLGFDCKIDDKSDVFQLGKLFWFIFNNNSPIGIIYKEDFIEKDLDLFELIYIMMFYSKEKRFSLDEVEYLLVPLCEKYGT